MIEPTHLPPHGTYARANVHWKSGETPCNTCALAAYRYKKRRVYEAEQGHPRRYPIRGYRRRYQALKTLGWTHAELAAELGCTTGALSNRVYRGNWVSAANHQRMADLYERACMTKLTGKHRTRTFKNAERNGYAPPLAWDDIDTDDAPNIGRDERRDTLAEYRHLVEGGVPEHEVLTRLGITPKGIEQALLRERRTA